MRFHAGHAVRPFEVNPLTCLVVSGARPHRLRPRAPQLDQHRAVYVLELRGLGLSPGGTILVVRAPLARSTEDARRRRQKHRRQLDRLRGVQVHVEETAAGFTIQHSDVKARGERTRKEPGHHIVGEVFPLVM